MHLKSKWVLSWVLLFSPARPGAEQAEHPLQSHVLKLGKPLGKGQAAPFGARSTAGRAWVLGTGTTTLPLCRPPSPCATQAGKKDCRGIQVPQLRGCFLNSSYPWCLDTKGWRGHPRPGRRGTEGARAGGLRSCLRSLAHPGNRHRQAGAAAPAGGGA